MPRTSAGIAQALVERHGVELGQAALSGACHGLLEGKSAANVHEQNLKELIGGGDPCQLSNQGPRLRKACYRIEAARRKDEAT